VKVSKMEAAGGGGGGGASAGVPNQKQELHTKMLGKMILNVLKVI
jgi:hypothetical protein